MFCGLYAVFCLNVNNSNRVERGCTMLHVGHVGSVASICLCLLASVSIYFCGSGIETNILGKLASICGVIYILAIWRRHCDY